MGKIPQLKNAPKSGAEKSVPEKRTGNAPKPGTSDDAPQKTHRPLTCAAAVCAEIKTAMNANKRNM